jgi:DNA repair exonuclease SbcCD ATPase subunit
MDKVEFGTLKFENFRRHDEGELDFPNGQLVAITGKNGQGKSSYLMAFQTALYGKTAEGIELSDLVNKRVGKNLSIQLPFTVTNSKGEKTEYEINRYYQHKKYKNKLVLLKDGKDISAKTATETYKMIESILIPRSVFLNTIYFSQQVKDFFTSLTDAKQKEIFEAILQLGEWETYYKNASDQLKQKNVDISVIEEDILTITARLPDKELEIDRMKQEHKQRVDEIKNQISELEAEIKQLQEYINNATNHDVSKLEESYQSVVEQMATATAHMQTLQNEKDQLESKLAAEKDERVKKIESDYTIQLQELKHQVEKEALEVKKSFTDKLPVLQEQLSKIAIERSKIDAEINNEQHQIYAKYDNSKLETEMTNELGKLLSDKKHNEQQCVTLKERHTSLKTDIDKLKADIASMTGDEVVCPTCNQKVEDTDHIEKEKAKLTKTFNEKVEVIKGVIAEYKPLKELVDSADELYKEKQALYEGKLKTLTDERVKLLEELQEKNVKLTSQFTKQSKEFDEQIENIENDMEKELQVYRNSFSKSKQEFAEKRSANLSELNKVMDEKAEKDKQEIKESIAKVFETVQSLNTQKDSIQSDLKTAREYAIEFEKKKALLGDKQNQLKALNEITIDGSDIKEKENELKELKKQIKSHQKNLVSEQKELEILKFWKAGFSDKGIPSMLIDEVVPFMNQAIKQELEKIAPGKYIVSFDTVSITKGGDLREKFAVNILNVETGADHHRLLSGGEKRQIDVCCMRVLRLLAEKLYQKSFNVTLLDEVLDSLDADNASIFCQHLKALSNGQNITLITHSMLQDAECDKVLSL